MLKTVLRAAGASAAIALALGASLFTALTIVPVLSYWFLRTPKAGSQAPAMSFEEESANPTPLQRGYLPALTAALG